VEIKYNVQTRCLALTDANPQHDELTTPCIEMSETTGTQKYIQAIETNNTTQHNTTQHNTTQHNTTQHNTTQKNIPVDLGACGDLDAVESTVVPVAVLRATDSEVVSVTDAPLCHAELRRLLNRKRATLVVSV
jgi:hypothetical protein